MATTCVLTGSNSVTYTIDDDVQVIDLQNVLASAQQLSPSLTTSSPMIIIAYGGAGGHGTGHSGTKSGPAGQGGKAQMTTSVESFQTAYGTTLLYLYLGEQGSSEHWGGKGGASTVVSVADLSTTGSTTSNIVLCAGGAGGGSGGDDSIGYSGGDGGSATSSLGKSATGAGVAGSDGGAATNIDVPAGGGAGGNNGVGGAGGAANSSQNIAGGAGTNGFGGRGGPVHLGNGPSVSGTWTNWGDTVPVGLSGGAGGEGEARGGKNLDGSQNTDFLAEGGGGGGGYGGGGGGGGWTYNDTKTNNDAGGGGGGGTFAAASTISSVKTPYDVPSVNQINNPGNGYVMIIFPAPTT